MSAKITPPITSRKISLQDAAAARSVSVRTVRRWISAGLIPGYRCGPHLLRVNPADLDALDRRLPTAGTTGGDAA